jgi:hypothetical protein
MEKISNYINLLFQKLFDTSKHPFFIDMDRVHKITRDHTNAKEKFLKEEIKYSSSTNLPKSLKLSINKREDTFDNDILKNLSEQMKKNSNYKKILDLVELLHFQNIPTNNLFDEDIKSQFRVFKNSKKINVAIIGAGPIGLFLACYLHKYYNSQFGMNDQPRVNIVIFDNRIVNSGLRKPYTRKRNFAFSSGFFSYIIPKIYSWNEDDKQEMMMNIFILEYLLFTKAYHEYNLPFIFNKYTWREYCELFAIGNFQVVFDCTGGSIKPPIFKDINTDWIENIIKKESKKPFDLQISSKDNLVSLNIGNNKFQKNYYYINLNVLDIESDNSLKNISYFDFVVENVSDLKLFINLKNKYYDIESLKLIIKKIKSNVTRNYIHNIIKKYYSRFNYIYEFDLFNTYMRHAIKVSTVVNFNDHKFLYIGAGDTIFHSHFITGAGLNRTVAFVVKCANFITELAVKENKI